MNFLSKATTGWKWCLAKNMCEGGGSWLLFGASGDLGVFSSSSRFLLWWKDLRVEYNPLCVLAHMGTVQHTNESLPVIQTIKEQNCISLETAVIHQDSIMQTQCRCVCTQCPPKWRCISSNISWRHTCARCLVPSCETGWEGEWQCKFLFLFFF